MSASRSDVLDTLNRPVWLYTAQCPSDFGLTIFSAAPGLPFRGRSPRTAWDALRSYLVTVSDMASNSARASFSLSN
jgi:hypothetical protein